MVGINNSAFREQWKFNKWGTSRSQWLAALLVFAIPAPHTRVSTMIRPSFAFAFVVIGFYFILNIMASDEQKEPKDILIDMGGKKIPLSKINKPHNVVVGGAHKAIPNLENFPSLEPWAKDQEQKDSEKTDSNAKKESK